MPGIGGSALLRLARESKNIGVGVNGEGTAISIPERDDESWLSMRRCAGLAEGLAGDIGETGERGDTGEKEIVVRSSWLARTASTRKYIADLNMTDLVAEPLRLQRTKEISQREKSHVLIIRECRGRACHKKNGEGQRVLKALYR